MTEVGWPDPYRVHAGIPDERAGVSTSPRSLAMRPTFDRSRSRTAARNSSPCFFHQARVTARGCRRTAGASTDLGSPRFRADQNDADRQDEGDEGRPHADDEAPLAGRQGADQDRCNQTAKAAAIIGNAHRQAA
ncbi:MAG: hypothetical protein QOF70_7992 [Acetobacteraceae bacterium]|nr:hypothetical protein [Acetobacteraceae bacterium]